MNHVNLMDILVSSHDQEIYHSRILAWLLDPAGSHGFGSQVLDGFLSIVFPDWPMDSVEQVKGELSLDSKNTPDIGIITPNKILLVENKIRFSAITEGQVERYMDSARRLGGGKEVKLAFLLPGPRKSYVQLEKTDDAINTIFWSEVADILGTLINKGNPAEGSLPSLLMYHEYICRTIAVGAQAVGLTPGHPKFSSSRSGLTTSLSSSRIEFLKEAREGCIGYPERLDLIYALVGYLETFDLLRVEYKQGNTQWAITGGIPRTDGGVTCIIGSYSNGRFWNEYRRLPDELAQEYRQLTDCFEPKGWRERWLEELPFEQNIKAIRTIAMKASVIELPIVSGRPAGETGAPRKRSGSKTWESDSSDRSECVETGLKASIENEKTQKQRIVGVPLKSLADARRYCDELKDAIKKHNRTADVPVTHARAWVWAEKTTNSSPETENGRQYGLEIRISYYKKGNGLS